MSKALQWANHLLSSRSATIRLLYPQPSEDERSVIVQRGDWINLSVGVPFPGVVDEHLVEHIFVNCAGVPLRVHSRPQSFIPKVFLRVEQRDVTHVFDGFSYAFCGKDHSLPSIPEDGTCGCLVCFHGRYFPIRHRGARREANICFEFPILENRSDTWRDYEYVDTHALSLVNTLKLELLGV